MFKICCFKLSLRVKFLLHISHEKGPFDVDGSSVEFPLFNKDNGKFEQFTDKGFIFDGFGSGRAVVLSKFKQKLNLRHKIQNWENLLKILQKLFRC